MSREYRVVLVLGAGFGLVGLDRFIIGPLFPVMAGDLGLDYLDIGIVAAALALAWGISAIVMGRLADRIGTRAIIVPAILAFSAFAGLSGLAAGLGGLVLLRALTGLAEGAFVPASVVATTRASAPSRIGLNVGLLHMAAAFAGLGLAPLLATQLLKVLPSWHWVFVVAGLPGVLIAYWASRTLPGDRPARIAVEVRPAASWRLVAGRRRVLANALAMACWLAVLTILAAFLPSYLTDHLGLDLDGMGIALSGLGLGGVAGMALVPALGDRFGHRKVLLAAVALKVAALGLFVIAPQSVALLFALLLAVGLAGAGATAITIGPLTGGAVEGSLAATATGIVAGAGEIAGGALAPAVAGFLATRFGIGIVPVLAMAVAALGWVAIGLGREGPREGQSLPADSDLLGDHPRTVRP